MKKLLILCMVSLFCVPSIAQLATTNRNYPILNTPLTAGIIHNFSDFQQGKVEKKRGQFILTENSEVAQYLFFGKRMKLAFKDSVTKAVSLVEGKIWGFCDGKDMYIRDKAQYCKLTIGKYCYYQKTKITVVYFVPFVWEELYFFKVGEGKKLDSYSMLSILKPYPDLLEAYNKDTTPKGKDILYLQKLNEL